MSARRTPLPAVPRDVAPTSARQHITGSFALNMLDNYATHKHAKVRQWLAARPRFHLHFTPTYSSWLNQVERRRHDRRYRAR